MLKRPVLISLAAAAISLPALALPALVTPAAAQLNISIGTAPPAPVYEVVPAPRVGYVWAPGYYRHDAGRYVWTTGRWMAERPGYRWTNDRWEYGPNGWYHVAGRWDRNGNGIPDRVESHTAWGDRDRDGVPNIYDSRQNNPYRR
jgi:hypothetical protein